MFISELANIYSKKPYLNNIIPFHEIAPKLEQFLIQEVRLGARNLNPYRFAFNFAVEAKNVINLFMAFSSSDGPLQRMYRYDCEDCGETNILTDETLVLFTCYNCESDGDIEKKEFLDNVKVIFEIKEPYIQDVKSRLKDQASSEKKVELKSTEEANKGDLSLKDAFKANHSAAPYVDRTLKQIENTIMNRLNMGLNST